MSRISFIGAAALLPVLVTGCIVIPVGDLLKGPALEEQVLSRGEGFFSRSKIVILDVDGTISSDESLGLLGSHDNTVSEVKARLNRARNDPEVSGVVLRISSPGGEVTACDTIYHELVEFKKARQVPVVASIVDMGASGGYYVASAADTIIAHPTAVVGSIGVVLQTFDISGLFQKIGVGTYAVKSSPMKDILSPFRERTPEETQVLQGLINDFYQRFVEVVAARPNGPNKDEVLKLADGRVFSGIEAKKVGLVDAVGYVPDALEEVKKRAHIDRRPEIIRYTRLARSGANIYSMAGVPQGRESAGGMTLSLNPDSWPRSRFLYIWEP